MNSTQDLLMAQWTALELHASANGPQDPVTKSSRLLHSLCQVLLMPLILVRPFTSLAAGLLMGLTCGLLSLGITFFLWWPAAALLISSSLLYKYVIPLRPILLIPGVLISEMLSGIFSLIGNFGDWQGGAFRFALLSSWPNSNLVAKTLFPGNQNFMNELSYEENAAQIELVKTPLSIEYILRFVAQIGGCLLMWVTGGFVWAFVPFLWPYDNGIYAGLLISTLIWLVISKVAVRYLDPVRSIFRVMFPYEAWTGRSAS
jgi:hypothetical protein